MSKRIFIMIACLFGLACGNKLLEAPENLIPKEQMADILYDMALLHAIDNSHPQVIKANDLKIMEFIYKKHQIDSAQFVQSDRYYASVPGEYRDIYEEVEARLTLKRDSITEIIQAGKPTSGDSIPPGEDYD